MTAPVNGTARWQLWVSVGTLGLVVFGAIIALYINLANVTNTATNARSTIEAMQARLDRLDSRTAQNSTDISVFRSNLTEVETQFRASDELRNLTHAADMRVTAMLWEKQFKSRYPTDNAYYPSISRNAPPAQ